MSIFEFSKQAVILDSKGEKSGYVHQAALCCNRDRMLWRGLVWSSRFVHGRCLKLWACFSPGHLCNSFWFRVFVLQSETCFSLSCIKSMSWNWIHLFVQPPNRNSVQPNWKQIILPSITDWATRVCVCVCVWVLVVCEHAFVVVCRLCSSEQHICACETLYPQVSLSLQTSHVAQQQHFFYSVWHHLPSRWTNNYFILSSNEGTTLACSTASPWTLDFTQETVAISFFVASYNNQQAPNVPKKHL